jgi:hypothetical protein
VNFAFPDWLSYGRSINYKYMIDKRQSTFSYEELIINLIKNKDYNNDSKEIILSDLKNLRDKEFKLHQIVISNGIININNNDKNKANNNNLNNNETNNIKQSLRDKTLNSTKKENSCCKFCLTDLFFSCIQCKCKNLTCLIHFNNTCNICKNDDKELIIKYSINELDDIIKKLEDE